MSPTEQIAFPFPTLLAIRAQLALAHVHVKCNLGGYYSLLDSALMEAELAAFRAADGASGDVPCPMVFSDEPLLVGAWRRGVKLAADKRCCWLSREGLPDTQMVFDLLLRGQRCEVNGHTLSPDEHGVWVTNPYGNDCGLWQQLTLGRVEEFLIDMAAGMEYDPIP